MSVSIKGELQTTVGKDSCLRGCPVEREKGSPDVLATAVGSLTCGQYIRGSQFIWLGIGNRRKNDSASITNGI
jgi:hypothetical protein